MCVLLCCERSSEHGSREPWLCVLFIALAQCEWHQAGHGAAAEVPIGGSEGSVELKRPPPKATSWLSLLGGRLKRRPDQMEEALKSGKKITGGLGTGVATTHPRAAALTSVPQT